METHENIDSQSINCDDHERDSDPYGNNGGKEDEQDSHQSNEFLGMTLYEDYDKESDEETNFNDYDNQKNVSNENINKGSEAIENHIGEIENGQNDMETPDIRSNNLSNNIESQFNDYMEINEETIDSEITEDAEVLQRVVEGFDHYSKKQSISQVVEKNNKKDISKIPSVEANDLVEFPNNYTCYHCDFKCSTRLALKLHENTDTTHKEIVRNSPDGPLSEKNESENHENEKLDSYQSEEIDDNMEKNIKVSNLDATAVMSNSQKVRANNLKSTKQQMNNTPELKKHKKTNSNFKVVCKKCNRTLSCLKGLKLHEHPFHVC